MADATGMSFAQYDFGQSAATNAQNMVNNQNQAYQGFMSKLPSYQTNMNNQTVDQGAQAYNAQKDTIDKSANQRGLLYSGLKQGAEQGAATQNAQNTQSQIATNNQNLNNYASGYGNQVANSNLANYQSNVGAAFNGYQNQLQTYNQGLGFLGQAAQGAGAGAALYAASDKKLKNDVKDGDKSAQDMVDNLKSKTFSYKDDPEDKHQLGILAQDMEKSPMGKAVVVETPKGKALDIGKALSAVLAVQSVMNKRLHKAGA